MARSHTLLPVTIGWTHWSLLAIVLTVVLMVMMLLIAG
jgi:hypothetical protein